MSAQITPHEAREAVLPKIPWRRTARIRELAAPLGGLSTRLTGNLFVDMRPTELFDIPTRARLARRAFEVEMDNGIKNFAEREGIVDMQFAETAYCLGRISGEVNPDGTLVELEPPYEINKATIEAIRNNLKPFGQP